MDRVSQADQVSTELPGCLVSNSQGQWWPTESFICQEATLRDSLMWEGREGACGNPSLKLTCRQVRIGRLGATQLLCAGELRSCGLPSPENAFGRTLQECNLWVKWLKLGPTGLFH